MIIAVTGKGEPMSLINREDLLQTLGITDMDCEKCGWYSRTAGRCKRGSDFEDACCAIDDAPEVKPEPHWIPVSERLPEDEQFVLATYKTTDRIHVCQYHEDGSRNQWYSLNDMCRAHNNVVLAWMPLPEPYREEGENR